MSKILKNVWNASPILFPVTQFMIPLFFVTSIFQRLNMTYYSNLLTESTSAFSKVEKLGIKSKRTKLLPTQSVMKRLNEMVHFSDI